MELQKGRPQDTTGRLAKEVRTYDLLDQLGMSYERIDHAPAMTMEGCQEIDEALQATVCKNLFLCNSVSAGQKSPFRGGKKTPIQGD